jgi:hypothetical protein
LEDAAVFHCIETAMTVVRAWPRDLLLVAGLEIFMFAWTFSAMHDHNVFGDRWGEPVPDDEWEDRPGSYDRNG